MKKIISYVILLTLSLVGAFAQEVTVVRTDGNGSERLAPQNSFNLGQGNINNANITIFENQKRQTIDGFGFALTQGSAETFASLSSAKREELLNEIFNPVSGIKNSIVRISIGASDLSNSSYSYNENSGDTDMSEFSLDGPDKQYLLPILKQILAINPDIKVLATPWTAPRWMKTNNSWIGGRLRNNMMSAYALYFRKYLEAMHAEGIKIWGLTVQNEPEHDGNEPSMLMDQDQQIDFINNHLRGQIENLSFGTPKVIAFDHNFNNTDYPTAVANSSDFVVGSAFHGYKGDVSAMSEVYERTGKDVYFTEQFTGSDGDFDGDLGYHMENIVIGSLRNWSKTVIEWNLSAYDNLYPRTPGGCTTCLGAITVSQGNYSRNVSYYIIAQVSKFVDPGAVVLKSTGNESELDIAFKNPDGSNVLMVYNRNSQYERDIRVNVGSKSFSYSVPTRSVITFKWRNSLPEVPNGLKADVISNGIELSWNATPGADSYDVYRATSSSGPFTVIKSNYMGTSFQDTGLPINTTYYYRIRAKNTVGNSANSNIVSAKVNSHNQIVPDGVYQIFSTVHDELITAPNAPDYDAFMAPVNLSDKSQLWRLKHIEFDIYTFENVKTGKYMGVNSNWCGLFGDLEGNYQLSDDNNKFKIVKGSEANKYVFQIAFDNCGGTSENSPIKAWDIQDGESGARIQTYHVNTTNLNQQFELISNVLGLRDVNFQPNSIKIFPNPVSNVLSINKAEFVNGLLSASLMDLKGRIVKKASFENTHSRLDIDVSDLDSGFYFLNLQNDEKNETFKIVITR